MTGAEGDKACEMDGNKGNAYRSKSSPHTMSMTLVGSNTHKTDAMMRLREAGSGAHRNILIGNAFGAGIKHDKCEKSDVVTQTAPIFLPAALYVSPRNLLSGGHFGFTPDSSCTGSADRISKVQKAKTIPMQMVSSSADEFSKKKIDPRPVGLAMSKKSIEAPFNGFFTKEAFSDAFAPTGDTWLTGWSYLDCVQGVLVNGKCKSGDPNAKFKPYETGIMYGMAAAHKTFGSRCGFAPMIKVVVDHPNYGMLKSAPGKGPGYCRNVASGVGNYQGQPCPITLDRSMKSAEDCQKLCSKEKYCDWFDYEEDKNGPTVMHECFMKSFFHDTKKAKAAGVFGKPTGSFTAAQRKSIVTPTAPTSTTGPRKTSSGQPASRR
jgi:hypothetical protein